ncbi:MAG: molybdate ABC transporter substrate-binding protein [Myxococcota bacterium]|nr:molybdate ABC transporter substrate-binding protein [Myxococcota bacterium]
MSLQEKGFSQADEPSSSSFAFHCWRAFGRITSGFVALFLTGLATSSAISDEIVLSAAVSLREPIEEISRNFEMTHPDTEIRVVLGASSTLARQIEFGAPASIFLSADREWVAYLVELSLIDEADPFPIGSNRLVVVRRKGARLDLLSPADLASADVERLALPPESVPLGRYARLWLEGHGLAQSMDEKVVVTEHARATLAAVENGHADTALVYETDALRSPKVEVAYEIPSVEQPQIVYLATLLQSGRSNDEARAFVSYLKSQEARMILVEAGFNSAPSATTRDSH